MYMYANQLLEREIFTFYAKYIEIFMYKLYFSVKRSIFLYDKKPDIALNVISQIIFLSLQTI